MACWTVHNKSDKIFWREETQLLHKICSAVILELVVWPVGEHKKKKRMVLDPFYTKPLQFYLIIS